MPKIKYIVIVLFVSFLCAYSVSGEENSKPIYFLDLDTSVRRELHEKSDSLRMSHKRIHGYMKVVFFVSQNGEVDSVTIHESTIGSSTQIIKEIVSEWRFSTISSERLPMALEYFLDINHKYTSTREEDDEKRILTVSVLATPIGRCFGAGVFIFPHYTGKLLRTGKMLEIEAMIDERDTPTVPIIITAGPSMAALIGNDVFPVSFFADLKLVIGQVFGIQCDQQLFFRVGGRFKGVVAAGFYQKWFFSASNGDFCFIGSRISAGIEF